MSTIIFKPTKYYF